MISIWVYIVRCSDGSYYTGITRNSVEARVWQHNCGMFGGYTATRRPVELVYAEQFSRIVDAIAHERRIKKWSRAKKEALIANDMELLKSLSSRRKQD